MAEYVVMMLRRSAPLRIWSAPVRANGRAKIGTVRAAHCAIHRQGGRLRKCGRETARLCRSVQRAVLAVKRDVMSPGTADTRRRASGSGQDPARIYPPQTTRRMLPSATSYCLRPLTVSRANCSTRHDRRAARAPACGHSARDIVDRPLAKALIRKTGLH
jgi:hypothetical protein